MMLFKIYMFYLRFLWEMELYVLNDEEDNCLLYVLNIICENGVMFGGIIFYYECEF